VPKTDFEPLEALVDGMAEVLLEVDFGGENHDVHATEYRDYAKEVCQAVWARGWEIRPRDDVLWSNEEGEDIAWGTAPIVRPENNASPS
jgi:hypothetical protein